MSQENKNTTPIFVRIRDVQKMLGVGRTTVYSLLCQDPTFPRQVRLSRRVTVWARDEILDWAHKQKRRARIQRNDIESDA